MARVDLRHIQKGYPGLKALDDVSLEIGSGEFFTLLGPSGCGKTTLLRMIAGFIRQDGGEVLVDGRRIDDMPAHKRNMGMVYQDYAIFPHLSVSDNVAFGLSMRRRPRAEIAERVQRALELVQLGTHGTRLPHELSGGQQQRVALARAMVINPQILLMDEPLSNLDAKLRVELREDIRDLQRSLAITTIYVTHDQEEALAISDRICVMQSGRVHQVDTPEAVYARPATLFVASFIGAMNVIAVEACGTELPERLRGAATMLAIRPEDVVVGRGGAAAGDGLALDGTVEKITFAGREAYAHVRAAGGLHILAHLHRPSADDLALTGAAIRLRLPLERLHRFDAGGKRLG